MDRYKPGMLAISKAGHDRGNIYVITETDDAYVYLADGRIRTLDKPKKKKKKHVQIVCKVYDITGAADTDIQYILKNWNKEEQQEGKIVCQKLM